MLVVLLAAAAGCGLSPARHRVQRRRPRGDVASTLYLTVGLADSFDTGSDDESIVVEATLDVHLVVVQLSSLAVPLACDSGGDGR